jgi:cell division protein YceG involved in septum cleavage
MMRVLTLGLAGLALVLVLLAAALYRDLVRNMTEPLQAQPGQERIVQLTEPTPPVAVYQRLVAEGLARPSWTVEGFLRNFVIGDHLPAGEYAMSSAQSAMRQLERIRDRDVVLYTVSVPSGADVSAVGARFEAAGLADADALRRVIRSPAFARALGIETASLEGLLFPDVYAFPKGRSPEWLVSSMVERFFGTLDDEFWTQAHARRMRLADVVGLASAIQRSPVPEKEWRLYSALMWTRQQLGFSLEPAPAAAEGPAVVFGDTRADRVGWPPVHGVPGEKALRAAVRPASGVPKFLVRTEDGRHIYCVDLDCVNEALGRPRRPVFSLPIP